MQEAFPEYTEKNHKEFKRILRESLDGTSARERECYNLPSKADVALHYLDSVLGSFGVEGWAFPNQYKEGFSYLNMGDTYATTLCYRSDIEKFFISSWGVFVEKNPSLSE